MARWYRGAPRCARNAAPCTAGPPAHAPPHHPVEVAPFEPLDEPFRDPIRGAPRRTIPNPIPSSLLTPRFVGLSWRTTWYVREGSY